MQTYPRAHYETMLELEEAMSSSEDYMTHARPYSSLEQMSDEDVDRFDDWTMAEYIEAASVPVDDEMYTRYEDEPF